MKHTKFAYLCLLLMGIFFSTQVNAKDYAICYDQHSHSYDEVCNNEQDYARHEHRERHQQHDYNDESLYLYGNTGYYGGYYIPPAPFYILPNYAY